MSGSAGVQDTTRGGLPSVYKTLIPITVGALPPQLAFPAGVEYRFCVRA